MYIMLSEGLEANEEIEQLDETRTLKSISNPGVLSELNPECALEKEML